MRWSLLINSFSLLRRQTTSNATPTTSSTFSLLKNHTMSTPEPISPSTTKVGWIGTGVIGRSMCAHILEAGYKLTVFNDTISKAQPLLDQGAHLATSPAEVAAQSDVVFTIVSFPSDGVLSLLQSRGILAYMTTSDPTLAVEISTAAAAKSITSIEAPVSGGDCGARTLSIFAVG
ncbi:probable 3-hydroxyisobutyrate dehydrogenase-like 1, mitochondrial [Spinacia oleracea]|uniref:Probable 3-hydroxyisobutyrate dehydrogenase-like 1, mitochondrial n=1 Tax=Spinacia oleracea TaxID=3562 RepID=A0ABM3RRE8_SPIOL|nr:probable 3-hydroxyisobutyrate dehydrogenase-like 1, mitochondrial [Spinacia oleracea]